MYLCVWSIDLPLFDIFWIIGCWNCSDSVMSFVFHFTGHFEYGTDILDFSPLSFQHGCLETVPPTCTATDVSALRWVLHANHDYYVTIKVTNLAGLTTLATSHPYKHNVRIPSPGIVYDVSPLSTGSSSFAVSNKYYNTLCLR